MYPARITMIDYSRPLSVRAQSRKHAGPYTWTPVQRATRDGRNTRCEGRGFYQSSDGLWMDERGSSFSLRLDYANTHHPINTRHTGTYAHSWGDDEFTAIVARLPHGRGFLAGYTLGRGMCASLSGEIFDTIEDAARAAYDEAERACEADAEFTAQELASEDEDA